MSNVPSSVRCGWDAEDAAINAAAMSYHGRELQKQLDRGPYAGEDFFRLQVTGNGTSRWINITAEQLAGIVALLANDGS